MNELTKAAAIISAQKIYDVKIYNNTEYALMTVKRGDVYLMYSIDTFGNTRAYNDERVYHFTIQRKLGNCMIALHKSILPHIWLDRFKAINYEYFKPLCDFYDKNYLQILN